MRLFFLPLLATMVVGCGADVVGSEASTSSKQQPSELVYSTSTQSFRVSHEDMNGDDTAVALNELVNAYDLADRRPVASLCYNGDKNRVCSLLSKMSKLSETRYEEGDHDMTTLEGCRALGRGKPVQAKFLAISDYEDSKFYKNLVIDRCN